MKKSNLLSILLLAGSFTLAENCPDWISHNKKSLTENNNTIQLAANKWAWQKNLFPVSGSKKYQISASFKSASKTKTKFCFGIFMADKYKRRIYSTNVNAISLTDTVLTADCKAGDSFIKIKDGSEWDEGKSYLVAFKVDASGKYRDLPNRNLSPRGITNIEQKEGYYQVNLKAPLKKSYPAGTTVRQHCSGAIALFGVGWKILGSEWTEFNFIIEPQQKPLCYNSKSLWNGCSYINILIMNCGNEKLEFKDIKIKEIN
jgi:hypothetical protein